MSWDKDNTQHSSELWSCLGTNIWRADYLKYSESISWAECAVSYFQDNTYHCIHFLQEENVQNSLEKKKDSASYYAKDKCSGGRDFRQEFWEIALDNWAQEEMCRDSQKQWLISQSPTTPTLIRPHQSFFFFYYLFLCVLLCGFPQNYFQLNFMTGIFSFY